MIVSSSNEITEYHCNSIYQQTGETVHVFANMEEIPLAVRREATILLTYGNDLTASTLDTFKSLHWIQMLSVGLDDLPFERLHKRGILVTHAKGIHVVPMSEYVLGTMLYFEKHFDRFLLNQRNRQWDRDTLVGELHQNSVLVFGTGVIGKEIAKKCKLFGMMVDGVNTSGREVEPFDSVFALDVAQSKLKDYSYIVIILPLTSDTYHLFSKEMLQQLHPNAVLINVGRGGIMDEEELYKILADKRIRGAALDVYKQEPLPKEHKFWELDNVLLTQHMSAKSNRYVDRCVDIFIENIKQYKHKQDRRLVNLVNLEKQY